MGGDGGVATAAEAAAETGRRHARQLRPIHPFPARMPPDLVAGILKRAEGGGRCLRVVDPMAGSGTVLAVARSRGHSAAGRDTDPLAVLIAGVWATPLDRGAVLRRAAAVLGEAKADYRASRADDAYPHGSDDETRRFAGYWFDPEARRQLASLASSIRRVRDGPVRSALWCAFSRLIIAKQAGASLAMDLAHSRPHRAYGRAPALPFAGFVAAAKRVAEGCIESGREGANEDGGAAGREADVRLGDARSLDMGDGSADMVITSPPYLNAIDYMRCSKFTLVWMGHTVGELRRIRAGAVGTEAGMYDFETGGEIDTALSMAVGRDGRAALGHRRMGILARYVSDMFSVLDEVARILKANGTAVFVVGENVTRGVSVRTPEIICEASSHAGLSVRSVKYRDIPAASRYLPPPPMATRGGGGAAIAMRMRREAIVVAVKA